MVELNEEARAYLTSDDAVSALMSQYGAPTIASTVSTVDYGLPLVIDGLKRRAEDSAGIVNLLNLVRSLDTSQLGTPAMWERASHRSDLGPDLLEMIFRDPSGQTAHETIVRKLSERARVTPATAHGILGSCSWMMLAVLVNRYSRSLDRQTLLRVTAKERALLSGQGWDPWVRSVEWERSAVASNKAIITGNIPAISSTAASSEQVGRYPPPVSRGDRGVTGSHPIVPDSFPDGGDRDAGFGGGIGGYGPPQRPPRRQVPPPEYGLFRGVDSDDGRMAGHHRPMTQQPQPMARHSRPRPLAPKPRRWPIAIAVAALLLIGTVAWWTLGRGDDTTDTDAAVGSGEENASTDEAGEAEATPAAEETDPGEPTADGGDPTVYTGIVTMEIPMRDIFSFEETSATGTVTITIDANTGEACALTSTSNVSGPYAAHIHLGSYPERGPIVVDFQPMNDGVEQCSANDLTDINEVLSDRTEYYAEMHDVAGNYTIRGQLSEATSFEDLRDPALIPVDDDGTAGFDTDPSQSGAVVRFEGSSLLAQGVVADQAIVDQLISSLEASGVPVINELRVEVGAPLPSGRFVANEGLTFPVGSDQLQGDNTAVLSAMVAVIQANPGWKLTVVGHTDDTGTRTDNLELSRRRANSVRTALEALGVDTDVLKVAGFGPDQPVADNATAEGRQRNRRIEFIIDPT